MDSDEDLWHGIVALILTAVAIGLSTTVLVDAWEWFVMPLGLPAVGWWHMFGLRGAIRMCVGLRTTEGKVTMKRAMGRAAGHALGWPVVWGMFAAVHAWGMQ